VTKGPAVNLRLVMVTVLAPCHGLSTRRPSLYHGYRGPADHDNQIRPSSAWALFQKLSLRRVQANNDPYRRYLCAL
jgi:hypothetical protein